MINSRTKGHPWYVSKAAELGNSPEHFKVGVSYTPVWKIDATFYEVISKAQEEVRKDHFVSSTYVPQAGGYLFGLSGQVSRFKVCEPGKGPYIDSSEAQDGHDLHDLLERQQGPRPGSACEPHCRPLQS